MSRESIYIKNNNKIKNKILYFFTQNNRCGLLKRSHNRIILDDPFLDHMKIKISKIMK